MVALVLADMGDPSAYESLGIGAMADGDSQSQVYQALGRLGASEPLNRCRRSSGTPIPRRAVSWSAVDARSSRGTRAGDRGNRGDVFAGRLEKDHARGRQFGGQPRDSGVERYLGDENLWRVAANGLWDLGTPEATAVLKARLVAEDYARSEDVLASLMERAAFQAQADGEEMRQSLIQRMSELLRNLQNSTNPSTRKAADDCLK